MAFRPPYPDNEDDFEQLCLRLYKKVWENESLVLYAKRGEKQDGVDIFDLLQLPPVGAIQCKFHETTKTISPAKIKAEVAKVEKWGFAIERYLIATTAKKSRKAQDTVAELNKRPDKRFTVEIHFWEEICQHGSELGRVVAEFVFYGENWLAGAAVPVTIGCAATPMASSGQIAASDGPYAEIERLLASRDIELARHELDKMPDESAAQSLPAADQYKILRLRAKYELESGEFDKAGRLFLRAHALMPELEQAKQNRVLGFSMLNDGENAYRYAVQYVAEGISTPVMVVRLIESSPTREALNSHSELIARYADTEEEINTALSHKHRVFGDYALASEAAARAVKIAPQSPYAHLSCALSLHNAALHGEVADRLSRLKSAISHYDTAEVAAREKKLRNLLPEILVNRAAARMLAGDAKGAAADFRAAVDAAIHKAPYADNAIAFFLQEQDFASAVALVDALDVNTDEGQYLSLVTRFHFCQPNEKRDFIEKMETLSEKVWDRAIECRFQCVQWAIEIGDSALASSFVDADFLRKHPFQGHALRAWIAHASGDNDLASDEAEKALNESVLEASSNEVRVLAHVLVELKDDNAALGLFDRIVRPGVLDNDTEVLINCAQRLGRHDLVLRICRDLRASGVTDERLRKTEIQLMSRYAPREAMQLAEDFIHTNANPAFFVAARNVLAVRLNLLDKLDLEESRLPTAAELPPEEANLVVMPYVIAGRYAHALKFLYAQLRANFENEHAHGRFIYFMLTYADRTGLTDAPETVGSDCAVSILPEHGEARWVVFEEDHPLPSRDEFSITSNLGQALAGRTVDDAITMPGNELQPATATIKEIQTKYVRAFQDSIKHFVSRFPGTSILQEFHLRDDASFDPSPIIKSLKGRRDLVKKCLAYYRDHFCSLYLFGHVLGITEFEAIKALSQHSEGIVKCCHATVQDFERAVSRGLDAQCIVFSTSAIVTLTIVEGWDYLDKSKRFLVSQQTSEAIDAWINECSEHKPESSGILSLGEEERLTFHEVREDERTARLNELRQIRKMIDTHCEITSSPTVAEIDPERRKLYEQGLGYHNLEAISLARDRGAVLWSDDIVVTLAARTDFGLDTIWTQLALRFFVTNNTLLIDDFDVVTAKLIAWHYTNIVWNARSLIAAGAVAQWSVDEWPFKELLATFAKSGLPKTEKANMIMKFLKLLRRSSCREIQQGGIIRAILDGLDDANSARWILQRLDAFFGVDILSAQFVAFELQYWLRLL